MPTRYESLSVFRLLESLQEGAIPSAFTVTPENSKAFTYPIEYEKRFDRHSTTLKTDNLPEDFKFSAEAQTFDITPDDKDTQKAALAKAFADGEIDEVTYLRFMNDVEASEEFEGRLLHTMWDTQYFLSRYPYETQNGLDVPTPLSYRSINDHHDRMPVREAEIKLHGFIISTSLVHVMKESLSLDNAKLRVTIPYSWHNEKENYGGHGDIEMVFNLESSTIQVFFQKTITNGYPLFTTSYTINVRTGLDRISRDDLVTHFQTPMFNEGDGKPPKFVEIEEFLYNLIEVASDHITRAMQVSFALMLTSYSSDI